MRKSRYKGNRKAYKKARHKKNLARAARWFYQKCIDGTITF